MQIVRKNAVDESVHHRLIIDHKAVVIDSAEAALYSPGGTELRAMGSVGVTVSNEAASLELPWSYDVGVGYRVLWRLVVNTDIYERDTFFRIALRKFNSTVTQEDVFKLHRNVSKFLDSQNPDFSSYLEWGWEFVATEVERHRGQYPEHVFEPGKFKLAHVALSLAEFYRDNASSKQSDHWEKAILYQELGERWLMNALDKLAADIDEDGLLDTDEKEESTRGLLRFGR